MCKTERVHVVGTVRTYLEDGCLSCRVDPAWHELDACEVAVPTLFCQGIHHHFQLFIGWPKARVRARGRAHEGEGELFLIFQVTLVNRGPS